MIGIAQQLVLEGGGGVSSNITKEQLENHYSIESGSKYLNWYTARPYGFRFTKGRSSTSFNLPILPKNINITTQFATNLVNTLYGVVEQHSENKYYDIQIQGTTGFAPQFLEPITDEIGSTPSSGRQGFSNSPSVLGGFLPNVENKINSFANTVKSIGNAITNKSSNQTGIYNDNNGYVAFHNFYRFLLEYKKQTAGASAGGSSKSGIAGAVTCALSNPVGAVTSAISGGGGGDKKASFVFYNYKDMQEYDCAIRSFTLNRSSDNPFLYNYSITIRAYNLRSIAVKQQDEEQLQALNLIKRYTGVDGTMPFAGMSKVVGNASQLLSGIL
jgi:hypothetical protein